MYARGDEEAVVLHHQDVGRAGERAPVLDGAAKAVALGQKGVDLAWFFWGVD